MVENKLKKRHRGDSRIFLISILSKSGKFFLLFKKTPSCYTLLQTDYYKLVSFYLLESQYFPFFSLVTFLSSVIYKFYVCPQRSEVVISLFFCIAICGKESDCQG